MAKNIRQGNQTAILLSDAELAALVDAAIAFDLEPAFREGWTGA